MSEKTEDYWLEYYRSPQKFGQIFSDYASLKATDRTVEQNVQFRVVCDLIDGKMSL